MDTAFVIVASGPPATPVLEVHGEVDYATAQDLFKAISAALAPGVPRLVVDLTGVTFIDSAGMSALVRGHVAARTLGTKFEIRHPADNVQRALATAGLLGLLT